MQHVHTHAQREAQEAAEKEVASIKEVHKNIGEYLAPAVPAWHEDYPQHPQQKVAKPKGHKKNVEPPIRHPTGQKWPQPPKGKPPDYLLVKKHGAKDPQQSKSQSQGSKGKSKTQTAQLLPPPPLNPNLIPLDS